MRYSVSGGCHYVGEKLMLGIHGKLLRVNLSESRVDTVSVGAEMWRKWLGGRGLGARLLFDLTTKGMEPLSESAPLLFITSPLMGTLAPGISKLALVFKSPLTGTGFVSLCGGHLGPAIRYAGWDGIIIQGCASKPTMLVINDNRVELRDAAELTGKTTGEAAEWIMKQWKGQEVHWAVTGPASEKGVRFSSIHSGRGREFGRGGGGLLMGSKQLKAIVAHGSGGVPVQDRVKVEQLAMEAWIRIKNDTKAQVRRRWGTLELVATINDLGFWPTRNFQEGYFPQGDKIDANSYEKSVLIGHRSCHSCPIICGKIGRFIAPDSSEFEMEGPEFESLSLLGPNIGLDTFDSIAYATRLCDELGVDTITMGNTIGVVMEAAEKRLLPEKPAGKIKIGFGDPEAVFDLIRRCALAGDELGKLMGLGPQKLAEAVGAPELAMTVKGLGLPAYDPRGIKGLGLNYATAAEGASHMRGPTMGPEIGSGRRLDERDKVAMVIDCQVSMALADSLGLCSTARGGMAPPNLAEFLEAITGESWTATELLDAAKRIITLERSYNIREGFSRADDTLPRRFLDEPMPSGNSKGARVELKSMLDEYYRQMGWDESGVPVVDDF